MDRSPVPICGGTIGGERLFCAVLPLQKQVVVTGKHLAIGGGSRPATRCVVAPDPRGRGDAINDHPARQRRGAEGTQVPGPLADRPDMTGKSMLFHDLARRQLAVRLAAPLGVDPEDLHRLLRLVVETDAGIGIGGAAASPARDRLQSLTRFFIAGIANCLLPGPVGQGVPLPFQGQAHQLVIAAEFQPFQSQPGRIGWFSGGLAQQGCQFTMVKRRPPRPLGGVGQHILHPIGPGGTVPEAAGIEPVNYQAVIQYLAGKGCLGLADPLPGGINSFGGRNADKRLAQRHR